MVNYFLSIYYIYEYKIKFAGQSGFENFPGKSRCEEENNDKKIKKEYKRIR